MQKFDPLDVAILFALKEEFDQFFPALPDPRVVDTDDKTQRSFVRFEQPSTAGPPYRCVTTFVGSMGAQDAGLVTSDLLDYYSPRTVILIGIAGSLDKDVLVGDVVVADQVTDYFQDARVGGAGYELAARSYKPHVRLKNAIDFLSVAHPNVWLAMEADAAQDLTATTKSLDLGKAEGIIRTGKLRQHTGHLASGPLVVANAAFAEWLRGQDRKYLAVEMEAAGVMDSVYLRAGDQRVLVIRGVSDMSDERKKTLDDIGKGAFRGLAVRNARRLIMALMELGKLERATALAPPPHIASSTKKNPRIGLRHSLGMTR